MMARVLIVDDMAVFREPIAAFLDSLGHETLVASDGATALELVRSKRPDLMLLDVGMPGLDGIGVLEAMSKSPVTPSCPVILLTAVAERDYVVRARDLGAHDYLLKSQFSLEDLRRRISTILEGPDGEAGVNPDADATPTDAPSAPGSSEPATSPRPTNRATAESIKELSPVATRSEIRELLDDAGELSGLSPTITSIIRMTDNPSTTVAQVVKVIRRDHAVALKVLKVANSAAYTRGDQVDSIDRAIVRIGMGTLREAILSIGVVETLGCASSATVDPREFWEHSIGVGLIAARLARGVEDVNPDRAFTLGLLHDIGRLVYADLLGERYADVLAAADELRQPLEHVERRMLQIDHAEAMDRIMRAWKFPRDLIDPIVFHHSSIDQIRHQAPQRVNEIAVLALADRLSHGLLLGRNGNDFIRPTVDYCEALRIGADDLHALASSAIDETDDMKIALLQGGATEWPSYADTLSEALPSEFRPLYLSPSALPDSYAMLCSRLGREGEADDPNVIVVHEPSTKSSHRCSQLLAEADKRIGGALRPLVVLSRNEGARSTIDPGARWHRRLGTPLSPEDFTETISEAISASANPVAAA